MSFSDPPHEPQITRRALLRYGGGMASALALGVGIMATSARPGAGPRSASANTATTSATTTTDSAEGAVTFCSTDGCSVETDEDLLAHSFPAVSGGPIPAFVTAVAARQSYRVAADTPDLLRALPCYCGCVDFDEPHSDLYACFVRSDGLWNPHGNGCGICQVEALNAERLLREGRSALEIRRHIDATYAASGPPTHTLMPLA